MHTKGNLCVVDSINEYNYQNIIFLVVKIKDSQSAKCSFKIGKDVYNYYHPHNKNEQVQLFISCYPHSVQD